MPQRKKSSRPKKSAKPSNKNTALVVACKPPKQKKTQLYRSPSASRAVHSICGLTDPFCAHANGAKYPDDSSARTLAYTFRGRKSLATDANGECAYLWFPQYAYQPITFASARTGGGVTAWTDFPASAYLSGTASYRIVSAGYILRSITAPLNASGIVSVRDYAAVPDRLTTVDMTTFNANATADIPLRLLNNFASISSHSSKMPQIFYPVGDDSAAIGSVSTERGFNPQTIFVTGAPINTTVITMEYVIHFELIFPDDQGLAQACTPPPPANSLITQSAARVTSQVPSFFERGAKALGDVVIRSAARALGTMLGGPSGGAIANHATALIMD
jgi:hypothetical protein